MEYLNKLIQGNSKEKLKQLPAKIVQCCVTSPPYYALRDYGTATWEGGNPDCDHAGNPMRTKANINKNTGAGNDVKNAEAREFYKHSCGKCGAIRVDEQIGLEETPEEYIGNLVEIFEEVRRVLTDDGTLWLNIGDSYAASGKNRTEEQAAAGSTLQGGKKTQFQILKQQNKITGDLKPKDLIGIPWMLAFALRAAGWYLRQDIIWHKPNPMPESVTDRCTKAHEYIFLLSKSKSYFYDAESIKTPVKDSSVQRLAQDINNQEGITRVPGKTNGTMKAVGGEMVNKKSVWTISTKPYSEAHFATFPPDLIIDCIKAGSELGDVILDPFSGAGTTAMVASKLGRNFIAIELNQKYIDIADKRLNKELGLFRK